jgi:hypothetical protein
VWNRSGDQNRVDPLRRRAHARQLGTVADEHGADLLVAARAQRLDRLDEVNGAVPCAERPREDRHGRDRQPHVRRLRPGVGPEALCIGAPLEDANALARYVGWNDRRVGRITGAFTSSTATARISAAERIASPPKL